MAFSLDDIWDKDADVVTQLPAESGPTPLFTGEHTSNDAPLFHSASLDDDEDHTWSKPTEATSGHLEDLDSMFDIPDEDLVVRPSSGDRGNTIPSSQPSSLHEVEIDPPTLAKKEGNTKSEKNSRVIPKLDNERLLGKDGLPALIKEAKVFKISDRGHEARDLTRLLYMYQLWSHRMYPKLPFKETVDKVEKLCHSKRLLISLSGYRDAEKEDAATKSGEEVNSPTRSARASSIDPEHDDDNTPATFDVIASENAVDRGDRQIGVQNNQPQKHTEGNSLEEDDMDIDALLNEFDEEARAISTNGNHSKLDSDSFGDDDMWDAMREFDQHDSWPSNHEHSEASNAVIVEGEAIKPQCIPHITPTQELEDDLYIN